MKKDFFLLSLIERDLFYAGVPGAGVPGQFITSPTGQVQINVIGSGPSIETIFLSQARDSSGYLVIAEAATNVLTVPAGVSVIAFHGATAGTATITTPAAPVDGQKLSIFSTAGVTTLTLTANTGQTIDNTTTVLAANASCAYIYQLSTTTWFRIK